MDRLFRKSRWLKASDRKIVKRGANMINEVLYMESRLLQQFCNKYKMTSIKANRLFKDCGIWQYIEECYDTLHMSGDESIINDISSIIMAKGVAL